MEIIGKKALYNYRTCQRIVTFLSFLHYQSNINVYTANKNCCKLIYF